MVSILVCSVNPSLLHQLKENIESTIGVPYEILAFDNRKSNEGLCRVYNRLGKQARYDILCFIHEDILFQTKDWGLAINNHLRDSSTGLIGLAGGDTKGIIPSTWSTGFKSKEINVIQHYYDGNHAAQQVLLSDSDILQSSKKVVNVDGLFLCTKKEVFERFKFDEERLTGFHGYDIDYSLQVFTKYDVKVIFDVLVEHYSTGKINTAWMKSTIIVTKKWKKHLPVSVYNLSKEEFNFFHWKSLQVFIQNLFFLKYNYFTIIYYYLHYSFTKYFSARRFLSMGKYVLSEMLQRKFEAYGDKKIIINKLNYSS